MIKSSHFDAADYLKNDETIAEYITAALEDPNPDVFLAALRNVARVKGSATGQGRLLQVEPEVLVYGFQPAVRNGFGSFC